MEKLLQNIEKKIYLLERNIERDKNLIVLWREIP